MVNTFYCSIMCFPKQIHTFLYVQKIILKISPKPLGTNVPTPALNVFVEDLILKVLGLCNRVLPYVMRCVSDMLDGTLRE